jgi:hypothetical protein
MPTLLAFTISDNILWTAIGAVVVALWGALVGLFALMRRLVAKQLDSQTAQIASLQAMCQRLEQAAGVAPPSTPMITGISGNTASGSMALISVSTKSG